MRITRAPHRLVATLAGSVALIAFLATAAPAATAAAPAKADTPAARPTTSVTTNAGGGVTAGDQPVLFAGSTLPNGGVIAEGRHRLIVQGDGNLVEYADSRAIWTTGTRSVGGATLTMQGDCNLVLRSATGVALWNTHTARPAGAMCQLALGTDGALTVSTYDGAKVWSSNVADSTLTAGQTLDAGEHIDAINQLGTLQMLDTGNLTLSINGHVAWQTNTGVPGSRLAMQSDGNAVVYTPANVAVWASHTFGTAARLSLGLDGRLIVFTSGVGKTLGTLAGPDSAGLYPFWYATCTTTGKQSGVGCTSDTFVDGTVTGDPWGGGLRQCTSFVLWWLASHNGNVAAASFLGNAGTWGVTLASMTNTKPTVGSVAWWKPSASSKLGHVAIVTKVVGTNVTVAQYNAGTPGSYTVVSGVKPNGYIHLGF